jgi:hypothetical protein
VRSTSAGSSLVSPGGFPGQIFKMVGVAAKLVVAIIPNMIEHIANCFKFMNVTF